MPTLICFNKYDKDLNMIPIAEKEWENCAQELELNLKRDKNGALCEAEYYDEDKEEYLPICWIDSDGGSMRDSVFPRNAERIIEIASFLGAIISNEECDIIYEPNYGLTYDTTSPFPVTLINIDDLKEYEIYYSSNIKQAIEELIIEKNESRRYKDTSPEIMAKRVTQLLEKPQKRWWQFWK